MPSQGVEENVQEKSDDGQRVVKRVGVLNLRYHL
jgi:hypothetical protein